MKRYDYIIIGNGIAGLSAVEEIKKHDSDYSVMMITKESYLTYMRPKLSHTLSKELAVDSILVKKPSWYEERSIETMLSTRVIHIDFEEKRIITDSGEFLYGKLLISSGSKPFMPPIEGLTEDNSGSLRNIEDLLKINKRTEHTGNITVIGGGVLGIESAVSFSDSGKNVDIVEFAPYILSRQLDQESSILVEKLLRKRNISIHKGTALNGVEKCGKSYSASLSDGSKIETEFLLVSTGIIPEIDFVRNSNIDINRGIRVDKHMKTNLNDVFAAGDAAEIEGRVIGLWKPSSDMGKCAGRNMVEGNSVEFLTEMPPTMMNIDGIKIFSIGDFSGADTVISSADDISRYFKIHVKNGIICGVILIGDTSRMSVFKKLVEEKVKPGSEYFSDNPYECFEKLCSL